MKWHIGRNTLIIAIACVIIGITIGFGSSIAFHRGAQDTPVAEPRTFAVPVGVNEVQNSFRSVAQRLLPSIVTVSVGTTRDANNPRIDQSPWFDFFFGQPNEDNGQNENTPEFRSRGFGSGVIVERAGSTYFVLTNAHVIGDADEIMVIFSDGTEKEAQLIGVDQRKDLALIAFQSQAGIPVAVLGDSETVQVGDWVLAIGSPFNFQSTVTAGIVSALGRRGGPQGNINDFIQTDAAINQGNSGGALVNIQGEVVGINTWITSRTGTNIGLGFAIPVNNIKKPIQDFIAKGRVEYGWLGISIRTPTDDEAVTLSLPDAQGAFVINVFDNSPADIAGILPGDVIVNIDDDAISSSDELLLTVGDYPVGKVATMQLYRQGVAQTIQVRITARESERDISDQNNKLWPGMRVTELTEDIRTRLDLERTVRGVVIENIEQRTPAAIAGLQSGDVITVINGESVNSIPTFYKALNKNRNGNIMFQFIRQGQPLSIGIVR